MEKTKVVLTEELVKINQKRNVMKNRCGGLMENQGGVALENFTIENDNFIIKKNDDKEEQ